MMIETEAALAKLQRLRYYSDYPLRLFLAALDATTGLKAGSIPVPEPAVWPFQDRRRPRLVWLQGQGRCPRCGRPDRVARVRRVH